MTPPVLLYGMPEWHDLLACRCPDHCRNCGAALTGRQRKYCSDYCGQRWRAEIDLDRRLTERESPP